MIPRTTHTIDKIGDIDAILALHDPAEIRLLPPDEEAPLVGDLPDRIQELYRKDDATLDADAAEELRADYRMLCEEAHYARHEALGLDPEETDRWVTFHRRSDNRFLSFPLHSE